MKQKTTEQFIIDAKKVHGDRYDYSSVIYLNSHKQIKIICKEHGEFSQLPIDHLKKHGCSKCSDNKKNNTTDFIIKCKKIYNEKYDYSKVNYINNKKEVIIICKEHGQFNARPDSFLQKRKKCPICNNKINNKDKFIKKANEVHNNLYDYSLVNYIHSEKNVTIICKEHGEFYQTPHNHMNGTKCPNCCKNKKITFDEFINKSNEIHGNLYDYSLVDYINTTTNIKIICKKHGEFIQSPSSHLSSSGCPVCRESKGEKTIHSFLQRNNIYFINQKRFKNCKNKSQLPFDFYLPIFNICIEYDGIQHFKPNEFFGGLEALNNTQNNDEIKTNYCSSNNIKLIRIPYYLFNEIDNILLEKIFN